MHIQLVSQSKFRTETRPGDDVPLIVPGLVYGVFDGATDPRGTIVEGIGAGRLAALSVAQDMSGLAAQPEFREMDGKALVQSLSETLARRTASLNLPVPPSTTVAVAIDCGDDWRFVLLGDSAIRLNGQEVLRQGKIIDAVSTAVRVAVFAHLSQRSRDSDNVEYDTRRTLFLGLDQAVKGGTISAAEAEAFIARAVDATDLHDSAADIARFLRGGLQTQYEFGNALGSALCFDTLNGTRPQLGHLIDDTRPKSAIRTIEIFSDGYPDLPQGTDATAWEAAFHAAERTDYHKTGAFATVKGSTSKEFFDDRTVLILSGL